MGGYRDEKESLRARIRELEAEVEELRGRLDATETKPTKKKEIILEHEFEGEVTEETHEEIVSLLRSELGAIGNVQQIGSTLAWSIQPTQQQPMVRSLAVTLESRHGKTKLRVVEQLAALHAQWVIGLGVGAGAGVGVAVAGIGAAISPPLFLLAVPAVASLVWLGKRKYKERAKEREVQLHELTRRLLKVAKDGRKAPGKVRVQTAEEEEVAVVEEEEEKESSA